LAKFGRLPDAGNFVIVVSPVYLAQGGRMDREEEIRSLIRRLSVATEEIASYHPDVVSVVERMYQIGCRPMIAFRTFITLYDINTGEIVPVSFPDDLLFRKRCSGRPSTNALPQ
jgi:hypothetical protein